MKSHPRPRLFTDTLVIAESNNKTHRGPQPQRAPAPPSRHAATLNRSSPARCHRTRLNVSLGRYRPQLRLGDDPRALRPRSPTPSARPHAAQPPAAITAAANTATLPSASHAVIARCPRRTLHIRPRLNHLDDDPGSEASESHSAKYFCWLRAIAGPVVSSGSEDRHTRKRSASASRCQV